MSVVSDPLLCAQSVVDRVGRDIALAVPIGVGKPVRFLNALYGLASADKSIRLRIFTGLSLVRPKGSSDLERRFVGPLLDRLFPTWPGLDYADALRQGTLPANVEVHEFFLQAGQWLSNATVQQNFASINYRHVAAHLRGIGTNVTAQAVAPHPAGEPKVSLSCNTDVTLDLVDYVGERRRNGPPIAVIGETNSHLPYMLGEAERPATDFDDILSVPGPSYDLFAPPKEPVALSDFAMALHVAPLIKDGGTLQIGIGSFSDALCHVLILRHTRNAEFRSLLAALRVELTPECEVGPFERGLYGCSEMLVDGFLALARAGVLTRRVPRGIGLDTADGPIVHAGFFVGSNAFYRELREMPEVMRARLAMTAISFTNTLAGEHQLKIMQRRDMRLVNTAMSATLLGAISAAELEDGRVVSGVGGQCDFAEMAHDLPGARGITAVRAARAGKWGRRQSNIHWRYANTSIPRQLRDIIVTEYGRADIRGRTDSETIGAMLAVSESAFQPALQDVATKAGKLSRSFVLPEQARVNTPERINERLAAARKSGLLPEFPLGSDMTAVEEGLLPALSMLRSADPLQLLRTFGVGLIGGAAGLQREKLKRMGLDDPHTLKERAMQALVLGALKRASSR